MSCGRAMNFESSAALYARVVGVCFFFNSNYGSVDNLCCCVQYAVFGFFFVVPFCGAKTVKAIC